MLELNGARPSRNNQVDVRFIIEEQDEVSVARIDIIGSLDEDDPDAPMDAAYIKDRLETREGGLLVGIFGGGTYKSDAFERDISVWVTSLGPRLHQGKSREPKG